LAGRLNEFEFWDAYLFFDIQINKHKKALMSTNAPVTLQGGTLSNLVVDGTLLVKNKIVVNGSVNIGGPGKAGDVLVRTANGKAKWSAVPMNQRLRDDVTSLQLEISDLTSIIDTLTTQVSYIIENCCSLPPPTAANVIFTNTSNTTLDIYYTAGAPVPAAPTVIATLVKTVGTFTWPIPTVHNVSGNFFAVPTGKPAIRGATLFEFGFNQVYPGDAVLRNTYDISTVPPIAPEPTSTRAECVSASLLAGFSDAQSHGYNFGISLVPPVSVEVGFLSTPVSVAVTSGVSAGAIGFPLDTAYPKQQTIHTVGDYALAFTNPVNS
jgi:hypothetical protein